MALEPAAWKRVHPSSLAFRLVAHVKTLIVPGLIFLWLARGSRWELLGFVLFLPLVAFEIVRYLSLRYCLAGGELVVREGLIFKSERHIPFQRIQNIDLVQGVVQRALGVAEVRVETASGTEPEAELRVLTLADAAEMRRRVFAGRGPEPPPDVAQAAEEPGAGAVLLRIPTRELVLLGLVSDRGLALAAVAIALAKEYGLFEGLEAVDARMERFVDSLSWQSFTVLALALALSIVVLLALASAVWTVVRLHGFTLRRNDDDLEIECGLLTRRFATVPRHRIQLVSVQAPPLLRLLGRATIRIETAGGFLKEGETLSRRWFVPILPSAEVDRLLERLGLGLQLGDIAWQPLAPGARGRMLRLRLLLALLVTTLLALTVDPSAAAAGLVVVPLAVASAFAQMRVLGYAHLPHAFVFRSGLLGRKTSAAPRDKVQVTATRASPFDRRHRMARLVVDTSGAGPAGHRLRVPYLEQDVAERLARELVSVAQPPRAAGTMAR